MTGVVKYIVLCGFLMSGCKPQYQVKETRSSHYELKNLPGDSISESKISGYKTKLELEMKTVIASSDSALTREGFEPKVGNFILQSMQHYVNTAHPHLKNNAVLIMNRGGLRNDLPQGNITKGNIFELMPFDNELVILTITGLKLSEAINSISTNKKLLAFNLQFNIQNNKPENIKVLDKKLIPEGEYIVVTTDYLANGGDNCSFFSKSLNCQVTKIKLRDAIISYCEFLTYNNRQIKPFYNGQITLSK